MTALAIQSSCTCNHVFVVDDKIPQLPAVPAVVCQESQETMPPKSFPEQVSAAVSPSQVAIVIWRGPSNMVHRLVFKTISHVMEADPGQARFQRCPPDASIVKEPMPTPVAGTIGQAAKALLQAVHLRVRCRSSEKLPQVARAVPVSPDCILNLSAKLESICKLPEPDPPTSFRKGT